MKPIAIFRFSRTEGPAYFGEWLDQRRLEWKLIAIDEGAAVPLDSEAFAGVVMMGGPMSVNDPLPWIDRLLGVVREAVAKDVPVLGHCLGGQLLAKALGAPVTRAKVPEIGWGAVEVVDENARREWFGNRGRFDTFQWHFESFAIPAGATKVLSNGFNDHQAYVMGPHIGLQCHIEMTRPLVESWLATGSKDIQRNPGPGVQDVAEITTDLDQRLAALSNVADDVYLRWSKALRS